MKKNKDTSYNNCNVNITGMDHKDEIQLEKSEKHLFSAPKTATEELVNLLIEENKQLRNQIDTLISIVSRQLNAPPF